MVLSRSSLRSMSSEADLPRSSAEMPVPIPARIDPTIVRTTDAPMALRSGHWKEMSAADTSPSRPSMIAKYTTGTTTATTALTHVIFSSNGMAASSLRLTMSEMFDIAYCKGKQTPCQVSFTPQRRDAVRRPSETGVSGGGEADRRRQLGQRLDARDVEVPAAPGAVQ